MKRTFANIKIYFDRSRGYTIYIQYFMIVAMFLKSMGFGGFKVWLLAGVAYIIGSITIGYLDYKLGIFGEEQRRHTTSNPMYTEMIKTLKRIESNQNAPTASELLPENEKPISKIF